MSVRGVAVLLFVAAALAAPAAAQRVSKFQHSVPSVGSEGVLRVSASTIPRIAPAKQTHTGVIMGTAVGLAAGWLAGRSVGDNFSVRLMIPLAALGAVLGLAFEPRE